MNNLVIATGGWLDVPRAAKYAGYDDADSQDPAARRKAVRAFLAWAKKQGVPCGHRGRRPLYLPADLDAALDPARSSRDRRRTLRAVHA